MLVRVSLIAALVAAMALPAVAQKKKRKTRDMLVQEDRQEFGESEYWIYNDMDKGIAEAKRSGKPLFVVIRCVT